MKQLPQFIEKNSRFRHVRYGYLRGLNGDEIAYAVQAAQAKGGVIIFHGKQEICRADILYDNYSHAEEIMYIGFDHENHTKLLSFSLNITSSPKECLATVKFELKHSYFNSLRKFVSEVGDDVVQKFLPLKQDFMCYSDKNRLYEQFVGMCSPDQFKALKAIAFSPVSGPPVLIEGPFGTGKTHTLAIGAHALFHEARLTSQVVRILVCSHHNQSPANFMEIFIRLRRHFPLNGMIKAILIDEDNRTNYMPDRQCYTCKSKEFLRYIQSQHFSRNVISNIIVVSTCMSSAHLSQDFHGFFTHVMIDEGAQMREPEAIASLRLANRNTKIIITGDHLQVHTKLVASYIAKY